MKTISILGTRSFVLVVILSVGLCFVFPAVADSVIVNPDGKLTYLGTLGGNSTVATDINDSGQVVGYSFTTANNFDSRHAFITGANGMGMTVSVRWVETTVEPSVSTLRGGWSVNP